MSKPSGRYDAGTGPLPVGMLPKFGRGATRRLRLAWIGLVAAGLAIVCSSAGAQTWDLGEDLFTHTEATRTNINPFSDSYGNTDVWHLMAASGLARNPSTYALIDVYRRDQCVAGLDYWGAPLGQPFGGDLGINTTADPINCATQVIPEHKPLAHPDLDNVVLYGWKSPITGTVTISGEISDADGACGNGVDWYVAHGSTDIAAGSIGNGGAQALGLTRVVQAGEFLYFIIDPKRKSLLRPDSGRRHHHGRYPDVGPRSGSFHPHVRHEDNHQPVLRLVREHRRLAPHGGIEPCS